MILGVSNTLRPSLPLAKKSKTKSAVGTLSSSFFVIPKAVPSLDTINRRNGFANADPNLVSSLSGFERWRNVR